VYQLNAAGRAADEAAVARAVQVVEPAARWAFGIAMAALLMQGGP
jgi:hypothetical protein